MKIHSKGIKVKCFDECKNPYYWFVMFAFGKYFNNSQAGRVEKECQTVKRVYPVHEIDIEFNRYVRMFLYSE